MDNQPEIIEERVVLAIRSRREHGLAKYGVGVERTDLTLQQWLQHAKEEAMDLAVYLERIQKELFPDSRLKKMLEVLTLDAPEALLIASGHLFKQGEDALCSICHEPLNDMIHIATNR